MAELLQTVEEAGLGPKLVLEFTVDSKVQDQRFANASSFGIGYVRRCFLLLVL